MKTDDPSVGVRYGAVLIDYLQSIKKTESLQFFVGPVHIDGEEVEDGANLMYLSKPPRPVLMVPMPTEVVDMEIIDGEPTKRSVVI